MGEIVNDWTIDELAALAGVPSRTIREYQRLDLLPPPRRDGRVGRYGADHRARLSVIGRLQERGYSLAAIGDLLGSWEQGRGLGAVLGVDADPTVLDEAPTALSLAQLVEIVPAMADATFVDDAVAVGLLHRHGEESVVARSLAVLELVGSSIAAGLSRSDALVMAEGIQAGAAMIASSTVDAFVEHIWPHRAGADVEAFMRRSRLLVAQAAASMVVHELGHALGAAARSTDDADLAAAVDGIAIGQLRRIADPDVSK